jgi:hypothetical protein
MELLYLIRCASYRLRQGAHCFANELSLVGTDTFYQVLDK